MNDFNDMHATLGAAAVAQTIDNAVRPSAKEPLLLQRPMPKALDFPKQALMGLEPFTTAIHYVVQAPYALCANSVLASACLAVQGHADVMLPISSTPRPLSLYFITIAKSGERKSTADKLASKAIEEKEHELMDEYYKGLSDYNDRKDIWDKERQSILGSKKTDANSKRCDLAALGAEPLEPLNPLLTFPEPTYQGLHSHLKRGWPSVGIFSDEGGQFIGGHAMREENKMETAAGMNSFWDGSPAKRLRVGDGTSSLYGKRVSMHLMVQPKVAQKLMADDLMEDQGFLARILVCCPDSTQGKRFYRETTPEVNDALSASYRDMKEILDRQLPLKGGQDNELAPRVLHLSKQARQLWIDFDARIEKQRGPEGNFSRLAGLANKLPELAARLAAVLALYDDIDCSEVSEAYMDAGIQLSEYYMQEALRIKDMQAIDGNLMLAEKVITWLKEKQYHHVPLQDIYQLAPFTEIRNAEKARQIMGVLTKHEYLVFINEGMKIDGRHRKEVWRVAA